MPHDAEQQELERVLAGARFRRAPKARSALQLLCEQHWTGTPLSQYELAEQLLGATDERATERARQQVSDVRGRLEEHYRGEGRSSRLHISVPQGQYVAHFQRQSRRRWPLAIAASLFLIVTLTAWSALQPPWLPDEALDRHLGYTYLAEWPTASTYRIRWEAEGPTEQIVLANGTLQLPHGQLALADPVTWEGQEYTEFALMLIGAADLTGDGVHELITVASHVRAAPTWIRVWSRKGERLASILHCGNPTSTLISDVDGDGIDELVVGGTHNGLGKAAEPIAVGEAVAIVIDLPSDEGQVPAEDGALPFAALPVTSNTVYRFPSTVAERHVGDRPRVGWLGPADDGGFVATVEHGTCGKESGDLRARYELLPSGAFGNSAFHDGIMTCVRRFVLNHPEALQHLAVDPWLAQDWEGLGRVRRWDGREWVPVPHENSGHHSARAGQ